MYTKITHSLAEAGVHSVEHGGVQSNPLLEHVRAGIAKVKEHHLKAVVAVGGGSVLDTAKAIAAGSVVDHDVWKFFAGKKTLKKASRYCSSRPASSL
ncbi:MAG TPA: iron-containing alcohol dehydrogenase [Sulfuricurvum sp.]|nr:iron-containing alcohol dehydrogenase [Sulfuricurvum sp.]